MKNEKNEDFIFFILSFFIVLFSNLDTVDSGAWPFLVRGVYLSPLLGLILHGCRSMFLISWKHCPFTGCGRG